MTKSELETLVKIYVVGIISYSPYKRKYRKLEELDLHSLAKKRLIRFTAGTTEVVPTKKGKDFLRDKCYVQVVEAIGRQHKERAEHTDLYQNPLFRGAINGIINKLPVSKLVELLVSKYPYVRKRAKVHIANTILETLDEQKDKKLTRALLTLGDPTIEAALIGGLVPTMRDAEVQWRKDLLSLDTTELVDRYMKVCLELNRSFTQRVVLLQKAFRDVARKFLKET